ncbi:MAG: type-F conjugative transfer system secretin TraK [Gammaproteobacteria bacterium]
MSVKIKAISVLCILFSFSAYAEQRVSVKGDKTLNAVVSNNQINRVAVDGDRIANVKGLAGKFQLDHNADTGEIFLQPNPDEKGPINVFLTTENGNTYSLHLTRKNGEPENITIIPAELLDVTTKEVEFEKSLPYEQAIVALIKAMHNADNLIGFDIKITNKSKPKLNGLNVIEKAVYKGSKLKGRVLEVSNKTMESVRIQEFDFYQKGDRAVAILMKEVFPQAKTHVYIVENI